MAKTNLFDPAKLNEEDKKKWMKITKFLDDVNEETKTKLGVSYSECMGVAPIMDEGRDMFQRAVKNNFDLPMLMSDFVRQNNLSVIEDGVDPDTVHEYNKYKMALYSMMESEKYESPALVGNAVFIPRGSSFIAVDVVQSGKGYAFGAWQADNIASEIPTDGSLSVMSDIGDAINKLEQKLAPTMHI